MFSLAEQLRSAIGLQQRGQLKQAQAICETLLRINPRLAEALHLLGVIALQQQQYAKAVELIGRAVASSPRNAAFYSNRGLALQRLNKFDAAIADFTKAISIKADSAEAYCNRGNALRRLGRFQAAIADFDKAISIRPNLADAYGNRGVALAKLNKLDAAIADYDKAISIRPDDANAYWNKALALLVVGELQTGFQLYEWRWKNPNSNMKPRPFAQPLWLGKEPLHDKRILLHTEQGLGDTIQFCRYAPLLARAGAQVYLLVPQPLVRLLQSLAGGVRQVLAEGEPLPDFDYHCPLMSLPLAFKTVLSTIPSSTPYLHADPVKARDWGERIGGRTNLKVGVVWNGGFRPYQLEISDANERRNIRLDLFARALNEVEVDFFSLQKGEPAESEIRHREIEYWPHGNFHNCASDLKDFSDTAALVANLDLVVSVDTSTAHLAAALGKPTWILNRFDTCWRWLLDRDDSPWYHSVKLYRQDESQNWEPVLQRVAADLTELANEHCTGY